MNQEASRPVSRQISELSPIFARTKKIKLMGNSPKYSPPPTVAEKIHILILKLWESATELSSLKLFHCSHNKLAKISFCYKKSYSLQPVHKCCVLLLNCNISWSSISNTVPYIVFKFCHSILVCPSSNQSTDNIPTPGK